MDVAPTSTPTGPAPTGPAQNGSAQKGASAATSTASDTNAISKDYQMFLNMMTTQLKNQDPMSPMNSDQFAVELATFSGVEQQTKTNDLLNQLLAASNTQSMAQMAGWVGDEARVSAPVYFDGTPVTLSPQPSADADRCTLVVTDQNGTVVDQRDIPVSSANYQWDGKDANGQPLPTGTYTLKLESYNADKLSSTAPIEYYAPVREIRSGTSGVSVLLPGQIEVPSSKVTALRAATVSAPVAAPATSS